MMPQVLVMGGGLAGLATAAALGFARYRVHVVEARPFLGGRATSYPLPAGESETGEVIDNCQHILLRCCGNLIDFYSRLEVGDHIDFFREFYFIEPGGRTSVLKAGRLRAPLHFTEAFLKASYLSLGEKISLGRALLALGREHGRRTDLDQITMLDWLKEKKQPKRVIDRFWSQVLVSAVNEDLDRMAAAHGFQVFWLGFLARKDCYEMGVPSIPLGDLYSSEAWDRIRTVHLSLRSPVERVIVEQNKVRGVVVNGETFTADYYVCALPFEKVPGLIPELGLDISAFEHSPITGIHLWFDRKVTNLPHGTLLDRTIQWFFNKGQGRYLQLVVSASRGLLPLSRNEVIDLALRELGEFLPEVRGAKLEKAHVVKEARATFSAKPGMEALRPGNAASIPNLFLAGDWTKTGWPATMEGAVRSGYLAAEAVAKAAGEPQRFVIPNIV